MFYSHTFLARKGPLSTVWIAAHLQHRLKKSHYTSTNIPSTVQHIMAPGVTIALRMSGHLLLGIVRIYSKKVDYLFHDCNVVLTGLSKAFASIQLTLPEDARQAPVLAITLPDTFDLDALNLGGDIDHNWIEDIHLRSQEDITLTDQVPVSTEHYVTISFDEDMMVDPSNTEVVPNSGDRPSVEDITSRSTSADVGGFQDHGQTTHFTGGDHPHNPHGREATNVSGPSDDSPPQATKDIPIENPRDANKDCNSENPPANPDHGDDTEPNRDIDQTMNEKDHIPEMVDMIPEGTPAPSQQHPGPSTPVNSQGVASDAQVDVEHSYSNLVLRESPTQQPQRKGKKRKQFFDEPIVLTNRFIWAALNNTRDILWNRRDMPSSTLGTWKLNNSRRKQDIFYQPLVTGLCKDLLDISKREYICSKPHLVISDLDMETECLLNIVTTPPLTIPVTAPPTIPAHDVYIEPNIDGDRRSPARRDDLTPVSAQKFKSALVSTTRTVQTPDLTPPGAPGSVIETPIFDTFPSVGFSETHQLINSSETEELSFLETEINTPVSSQGTSEGTNLSVRTRC